MNTAYTEGKKFTKINYSETSLPKGEYENCVFDQCVFSRSDLSGLQFVDCSFVACDLSLAKVHGTTLREVKMKDCKVMGIHFENCNEFLFSVEMEKCIVNHSSFYKMVLKKTRFRNCTFEDADFTDADLSSSVFDNCDLLNAKFENTNLEKADLRTAVHYSIDPSVNRIKKAKFSMPAVLGLLDRFEIEIE